MGDSYVWIKLNLFLDMAWTAYSAASPPASVLTGPLRPQHPLVRTSVYVVLLTRILVILHSLSWMPLRLQNLFGVL